MRTRQSTRSTIIVTSFLFLTTSQFGVAQERTPSLSETLSWIEGQMNTNGSSFYSNRTLERKVEYAAFDGCTLKYKHAYYFGSNVGMMIDEVSVQLGSLDPATVDVSSGHEGDSYFVTLSTRNREKKILIKSKEDPAKYANYINIPFKDKEIASRVANAFRHAIKLCKEPF